MQLAGLAAIPFALGVLAGYYLAGLPLVVLALVVGWIAWVAWTEIGRAGGSGAIGLFLVFFVPAALFLIGLVTTGVVVRIDWDIPGWNGWLR